MKKQTLKKLALKKAQISKLEDIKGGVHDGLRLPQTCIGNACPITMFIVCPARAEV